ncbi:histidine phosphatase family protein [Streptomyces sp. NPDC006261]|uniref:histidine phosphatase family protein n=1 Tax=Streptomyces sp. NPDC006261 TaxID=3156739 RepID=UPI0033AF2CE9
MATRRLYVVRHGAADAFGALTDVGQRQTQLLAERLARLPIGAVWHSPLPRAVRSAQLIGERLGGVPVQPAPELIDHVPHVPEKPPAAMAGVFDGYDPVEAATGERLADALTDRFARDADVETNEVLITHAYQVAWLLRHALDSPRERWLGLNCGNASVTAIEYYTGAAPSVLVYNDMSHLPAELRWTGFGPGVRP